ncbi:MAG: hypothetical protein IT379_25395 [Deltaproteobacteria bacterium]|nr:hypothetical protein [Deltaproteobacteria bacterium]
MDAFCGEFVPGQRVSRVEVERFGRVHDIYVVVEAGALNWDAEGYLAVWLQMRRICYLEIRGGRIASVRVITLG